MTNFLCLKKSIKMLKIFLLSIFLVFAIADAVDDSGCEGSGWYAYKDEKCFKLIKKWANREEAAQLCEAEALQSDTVAPGLVSIKSKQEQADLATFIFDTNAVKVNVWIGAQRKADGQFGWDDGSSIQYSNWASGGPTDEPDRGCVEMQSRLTMRNGTTLSVRLSVRGSSGQWRDTTCEQANYVVCQKLQRWSLDKLQQTVLDSRKNQVPIDFVYVQLGNQLDAPTLWPALGWEDVTDQFTGQIPGCHGVWKRIY